MSLPLVLQNLGSKVLIFMYHNIFRIYSNKYINKINDEPISSQLVILSNVKEDSTEQFNTQGYLILSSN